MKNELIEGDDFYYNEEGFMVLTAKYLLERGECCGSGCKHCPYKSPQTTAKEKPPAPEGGALDSDD